MTTFHTLEEAMKELDERYGSDSELSKFLALKYGTHIHHGPVMERIKDFLSLVWQSALHKGYQEESMNCHNHCKEAVEARNKELAEKVEALKVRGQTYPSELDDVISLINK